MKKSIRTTKSTNIKPMGMFPYAPVIHRLLKYTCLSWKICLIYPVTWFLAGSQFQKYNLKKKKQSHFVADIYALVLKRNPT